MLSAVIINRSVRRATAASSRSRPVSKRPGVRDLDRIPKAFLEKWVAKTARVLLKQKITASARRLLMDAQEVSLVFVSRDEIRRLNREFRGKDKATDVLSFAPTDEGSLGELVLCLSVVRPQSVDHGLTLKEELGYMVLHGVLHLLGYDHELSAHAATKMLSLQDRVFEKLLDT